MSAKQLFIGISKFVRSLLQRRTKAQRLGQLGERYAVNYLASQGHKILMRNFKTRVGEIDIISYKTELNFFEIKTRAYGDKIEPFKRSQYNSLLKAINIFFTSEIYKSIQKSAPSIYNKEEYMISGILITHQDGKFINIELYENLHF